VLAGRSASGCTFSLDRARRDQTLVLRRPRRETALRISTAHYAGEIARRRGARNAAPSLASHRRGRSQLVRHARADARGCPRHGTGLARRCTRQDSARVRGAHGRARLPATRRMPAAPSYLPGACCASRSRPTRLRPFERGRMPVACSWRRPGRRCRLARDGAARARRSLRRGAQQLSDLRRAASSDSAGKGRTVSSP